MQRFQQTPSVSQEKRLSVYIANLCKPMSSFIVGHHLYRGVPFMDCLNRLHTERAACLSELSQLAMARFINLCSICEHCTKW